MNAQRTVYFLMANLGSELIRFFTLQKQGDTENARASSARAFHIIDQLMAREDIGNGRQEVAILRKLIDDSLSVSHIYAVSNDELHSYFMPFASRVLAA